MADLNKFFGFTAQWIGDGVNSSVVVRLSRDPVFLGSVPSDAFQIAKPLPVAISNVAVGGATLNTSSYDPLTGELTVTFTGVPANGALGNITGDLEYA